MKVCKVILGCAGVGALIWGNNSAAAYSSPLPMPKGVRAVAFVYGFATGIDGRFNEDGFHEKFSHPLNRTVSLEELAEVEPELLRLKNVLNGLDSKWGDQLLNVNLYADISVFESRKVMGFMYGLSDRFALGFQLPWIERSLSYDLKADVVNNAEAIGSYIGNIPELQSALKELHNYPLGAKSFTDEIFLSRGYEAPSNGTRGAWGDLEIESRYTYYMDENWGLGLRSRLQIPTSNYEVNIRNILDQDFSDKSWGFKLSHLSELTIVPQILSWSMTMGGVMRLPKSQTRAYALSEDQLLPDLNDPNQIEEVRKTIGPEFNATSGLQLSLFKGWVNLMGSYYYSVKGEDKIKGQRGLDYERETYNSAAMSHGYEMSLEFSTIAPYQRNVFFAPIRLSAAYVHPVGGRDTIFAPYWRFDSVLLF